jgi:hypothetical protein
MTDSSVSAAASSTGDVAQRERAPASPTMVPPPPATAKGRSGWTAGRITALVIGILMLFPAVGFIGAGGAGLWADLSHRDSAGYVTTDVHAFSTAGSALVTDPIELGNPGVGWLYSTVVLGNVRIRVTPTNTGSATFVGIGPTANVEGYLAGVSHTVISDYWSDKVEPVAGGTLSTPPQSQDFWVAFASGSGPQTLTWDPANGTWTVVVMNADGKPGVDVTTDFGAKLPSLIGIAVFSLVIGVLLLIGGAVLVIAAIRRSRRPATITAA